MAAGGEGSETLSNGHPILSVLTVVMGVLPLVAFEFIIEPLVEAVPLVLFHMPKIFIAMFVPNFFKALTGDPGFVRKAEVRASQLRAQAAELLATGDI